MLYLITDNALICKKYIYEELVTSYLINRRLFSSYFQGSLKKKEKKTFELCLNLAWVFK